MRVTAVAVTQRPGVLYRLRLSQIPCESVAALKEDEACGIRNGRKMAGKRTLDDALSQINLLFNVSSYLSPSVLEDEESTTLSNEIVNEGTENDNEDVISGNEFRITLTTESPTKAIEVVNINIENTFKGTPEKQEINEFQLMTAQQLDELRTLLEIILTERSDQKVGAIIPSTFNQEISKENISFFNDGKRPPSTQNELQQNRNDFFPNDKGSTRLPLKQTLSFGDINRLPSNVKNRKRPGNIGDISVGGVRFGALNKLPQRNNNRQETNTFGLPSSSPKIKDIQKPQKLRRPPSSSEVKDDLDSDVRIVGGLPIMQFQFPWMAILLLDDEIYCGATLVSHEWVLTAAHCVNLFEETEALLPRYSVYLGAYEMTRPSEPMRIKLPVTEIVAYPAHFQNRYDIAMVRLNESVTYSVAVRPLCLRLKDDTEEQPTNVIIAGWGEVGNLQLSPIPRAAFVDIVDKNTCQQAWSMQQITILDSMICAGRQGVGTCNGDSGGSLLAQGENGLYFALGVTSFGPPVCATPGFPDVFTKVSFFRNWLALVIAS